MSCERVCGGGPGGGNMWALWIGWLFVVGRGADAEMGTLIH